MRLLLLCTVVLLSGGKSVQGFKFQTENEETAQHKEPEKVTSDNEDAVNFGASEGMQLNSLS